MSPFAIRADGLGKQYRIGARVQYRTIRETIAGAFTRAFQRGDAPADAARIWALRDVSFEIARGEAVGIIGRNGAGKSTLLKVLSRITHPTTGSGEVYGRIGSLLEVGTGFHPELTGRENIFLSGAVLGMRRTEIHRRFDEIVAFAGVDRFIDTPVKHYSTGMYTRLAFSVAAHLQTEILLVDEVLAVGDAGFQLKCLNRMSEVAGSGRTVLFVSHNMEAVAKLCERVMVLDEGRLTYFGSPQEAIGRYMESVRAEQARQPDIVSLKVHPGRTKSHDGPVRLTSLRFEDEQGHPTSTVRSGGPFTAVIGYDLMPGSGPQDAYFALTLSNIFNVRLASCRSHDTRGEAIRVTQSGEVRCVIRRLPLAAGSYGISVGCNTEAGFSDGVNNAAVFEVIGQDFYPSGLTPPRTQGDVLFDHEWEILSTEPVGEAGWR